MPTGEMIVLASSKKLGGRCIAGISTESGEWLRPVADTPGGLQKFHCQVEGRWPEPLDIVRFGYEEPCAEPAQPENVLIDEQAWELKGHLPPSGAYEALKGNFVRGPTLLGNRGAAVPESVAAKGLGASLALVEPLDGVEFLLRPPEETQGTLKPKVGFSLRGKRYELRLTDFEVGPSVRRLAPGSYTPEALGFTPEQTLLTISLAEAQNGWHTKLAAAVLFL